MNWLLLVPGLASFGGIQRRDRYLIKAMDLFFGENDDCLIVLSLNDSSVDPLHIDLQNLQITKVFNFDANRIRFSLTAIRNFAWADFVFYGLLGFAPLVFFQKVLSLSSKSFLLMHGTEVWKKRRGIYSLAARQIDSAISISRYTIEQYRQIYRIPDSQIGFVLPNSLGPDKIVPDISSKANQAVQIGPRLLSVARLATEERLKGIDTVIQILPTLLTDFPDLKYIIIGDGSDRLRLEHLAKQLRVTHAVDFRGFVPEEELDREYATCTVFIMPSASEGFGLVFIEAMSHGKPVIAARVGGTPEVIQDGVTGLLVSYGNVSELIVALSSLLQDNELRNRMGKAGLQRILKEYTFDVYRLRVAHILSTLSRE